MFHVEHEDVKAGGPVTPNGDDESVGVDEISGPGGRIFGSRLELAQQYAGILAADGVERGIIGPGEADRIWDRHVLNCAVLAELLAPGSHVVDVGSGAGLPGLVLALARPDLRIELVEPLLRRATFLTEVAGELGVDVRVVRGRAEDAAVLAEVGGADVVTARAVAPLAKLMRWCLPLARVEGRVLAMKGRTAPAELERDRSAILRLGGTELRVVECGVGVVEPVALVVEAVRGAGRRRSRR